MSDVSKVIGAALIGPVKTDISKIVGAVIIGPPYSNISKIVGAALIQSSDAGQRIRPQIFVCT